MSEDQMHRVFTDYIDAFGRPTPTEQEQLLRSSLAEDVVFTNPGVEGRGLGNLIGHAAGFQKRFLGAYFRINWLRHQHGQLLSEWTQCRSDGTELITAHSYARFNEEGRIAHLAGFWAPGAV